MSKTRVLTMVALAVAVAIFLLPTLGHAVSVRALAGLTLRDGRPVVLLYDCPHYQIVEVTVVPATKDGPPETARGWTLRRSLSVPLPTSVPLLGPTPPGWSVAEASALTTGTTGTDLTDLVPGQEYHLGTYDRHDVDALGTAVTDFEFTAADVRGLAPGQVIVGYMKNFEKTGEKKFWSDAKDGC
ncbi:hypothetical protein [Actinoplanes sp. HUAS TT8]|uniref:hypothetical protein n=1 Tax=Actinoplanes sp. HUAS TT8 TaxID=3447453 RepID=UPI003F51BC33